MRPHNWRPEWSCSWLLHWPQGWRLYWARGWRLENPLCTQMQETRSEATWGGDLGPVVQLEQQQHQAEMAACDVAQVLLSPA